MGFYNREIEKPFTAIPDRIMKSEEWGQLRPAAQAVYVQLKARWMSKNGHGRYNTSVKELKFSYKNMNAKMCKEAFYGAIQELIKNGFIKIVKHGDFNNKSSVYSLLMEKGYV